MTRTEPVVVADVARLAVAALVAAGWVGIDEHAVSSLITAVGVIVSVGLTAWTRSRVAPVPSTSVRSDPPA